MIEQLQRIAQAIWENEVIFYFCFPIVSLFAVSLVISLTIFAFSFFPFASDWAWTRLRNFANAVPNIIVSIGIFGTFFGILFGLIDFDVLNATQSVPQLIEGLKLAFATSVVALACSVILKVVQAITPVLSGSDDKGDPTNAFLETLRNIEKSNRKIEKRLKKGFAKQIEEFRDFSKQMSKAFSEAIIKELKATIREFNEKLAEQFGENFKQLNHAVGKLLEWQENYKQQMEELQNAYAAAVKGIAKIQQSLAKIDDSLAHIPDHLEKMEGIQAILNKTLEELNAGLGSMAEMREKAEGAFPAISDKIDGVVSNVQAIASTMEQTSTKFAADMTESAEGFTEQVSESIENIGEELEASVGAIGKKIESLLSEQEKAQQELRDKLQASVSDMVKTINDSIPQLDEAMKKQIGGAMQEMANNLSGIAQQLTTDYQPLLQASRRLVEIAEQAQRQNREQDRG